MAHSSLHRHFHTHTKKLCRAPPEPPPSPPPCWPTRIPVKLQATLSKADGSLRCQHTAVLLVPLTSRPGWYCFFELPDPPTSFPGFYLWIRLVPAAMQVDVGVRIHCSAYVSASAVTYNYSLDPPPGPHHYSIPTALWSSADPYFVVNRFAFTV